MKSLTLLFLLLVLPCSAQQYNLTWVWSPSPSTNVTYSFYWNNGISNAVSNVGTNTMFQMNGVTNNVSAYVRAVRGAESSDPTETVTWTVPPQTNSIPVKPLPPGLPRVTVEVKVTVN